VFTDVTSRRWLVLRALAEEHLRHGFFGRAARVYGWGIAVSYGALMLVAPGSAFALFTRALVTALGIVGSLVASALFCDVLAAPRRDAVAGLARENGFDRRELLLARGAAAVVSFVKLAGAPGALLACLALALHVVKAGAAP
jgi:hypothetical protein